MMRSGETCIINSMNRKRVGMSSVNRPSGKPSQTNSAPMKSAEDWASLRRRADTCSGSPSGWARPSVTTHITTFSPAWAKRSSVPPQLTSKSSGWAPIARIFIVPPAFRVMNDRKNFPLLAEPLSQSFRFFRFMHIRGWILPAAIFGSECIRLFGTPTPPSVRPGARVCRRQHRVNHCPSRLDRVLAAKERAVTCHCISQKSLVGRLLARLFLNQKEILLFAHKFLSFALDPRRERNGRLGRKSKAQIVCLPDRRWRVVEESLWRWLELDEHLVDSFRQIFARAQVPGNAIPAP